MAGHETIVIVGNGPVPQDAAPQIAGAGLVVRFNDCRSFLPGERSDVIAVCNTGRPAKAMLETEDWTRHPAVAGAGAIWCVRDPVLFADLRQELSLTHPGLEDFCDDETERFADFAARTGKVFRIIDGAVHRSLDLALHAQGAEPYVVPSSGMVVIADLLADHPLADISITGFTHAGWEGHPFATEARLVEGWVEQGRLRRIDTMPPPVSSFPISELSR